ncbi:unnamed protein product, partial [Urochloa humidicola]
GGVRRSGEAPARSWQRQTARAGPRAAATETDGGARRVSEGLGGRGGRRRRRRCEGHRRWRQTAACDEATDGRGDPGCDSRARGWLSGCAPPLGRTLPDPGATGGAVGRLGRLQAAGGREGRERRKGGSVSH